MLLITVLIVIILLLCIKTLFNDLRLLPCRGFLNNTILIDVAGVRDNFGVTSLANGINYRSSILNSYSQGDDDNDDNSDSGGGNFTNRKRNDSRYLEDVIDDQCWSDVCMQDSLSGKIVGTACNSKCSTNPGPGYVRTFGDTKLMYNDNIADSQYKNIQYINSDKSIIVPNSFMYNNIVPANPSMR